MADESVVTPAPTPAAPETRVPDTNRYYVELRNPDPAIDGRDEEVYARDEDNARTAALALAPEGSTVERCVLMQIEVERPPVLPGTESEAAPTAAPPAA